MKSYAEIIADQIRAAGWTVGGATFVQTGRSTLYEATAENGDGRKFIARAEHPAFALDALQKMIQEHEAPDR